MTKRTEAEVRARELIGAWTTAKAKLDLCERRMETAAATGFTCGGAPEELLADWREASVACGQARERLKQPGPDICPTPLRLFPLGTPVQEISRAFASPAEFPPGHPVHEVPSALATAQPDPNRAGSVPSVFAADPRLGPNW